MAVRQAAVVADSDNAVVEPVPGRQSILGVQLDLADSSTIRDRLRRYLIDPWDGRCRHVVTLNPEYVMAADRDPTFANAIASADLVTADGIGVLMAARLLGGADASDVTRVTGGDLVAWLAEESSRRDAPLFLVGGRSGVASAAARKLAASDSDVRVAGWWSGGSAASEDDEEAILRIGQSGAKAVLVAYGAPGQVFWIERNQAALAAVGVRVAIGVGGVLDYLAGTARVPPSIVRRAGLEWLYRLLREPWRWRRQKVLPVFALRVLIARLWRRGNRAARIARQK